VHKLNQEIKSIKLKDVPGIMMALCLMVNGYVRQTLQKLAGTYKLHKLLIVGSLLTQANSTNCSAHGYYNLSE